MLRYELREVTTPENISRYSPLPPSAVNQTLKRVGARSPHMKSAFTTEYNEAVISYTKIDKTTILYLPSDVPSTKAVQPQTVKRTERVARNFLSNCIYFVYNTEGYHPRVLVGNAVNYQHISTKERSQLASDLLSWLIKNPSVTKVMIADTRILSTLLPYGIRPNSTSIKGSFLEVYKFSLNGIERTLMAVPTPTQLYDNDEKAYVLTSDIYNYIGDVRESLKAKGSVLKSVIELESAMRRVEAEFKRTKDKVSVGIDVETTGLIPFYHDQHILTCAFSSGIAATTFSFIVDHPKASKEERALGLEMLKVLISKEDWLYVFQHGKFDLKWIHHAIGMYPAGSLADTMLIDHYLSETYGSLSKSLKLRIVSMDSQIPRYLHYKSHKTDMEKILVFASRYNEYSFPKAKEITTMKEVRELIKLVSHNFIEPKSGQYANVEIALLLSYNSDDAFQTANIYNVMMRKVREENNGGVPKVISHLHERQMLIAAEMESNGFPIDYKKVRKGIAQCDKIVDKSRAELDVFDLGFNPESNKQTIEYFKGTGWDLTPLKDEDSGEIKTDSDKLMKFADKAPWIPIFLTMKKALKARNTYFIPFITHSYKGIVYFSLNLHGTSTGRLSSNNPNFQNIPYYIEAGKEVIDVKSVLWSGDENSVLFDADLSSAEVKVLTVYVPDKHLIARIKAGDDLHCYSASVMNPDVDYHAAEAAKRKKDRKEDLNAEEKYLVKKRGESKSATFGTIYGTGAAGLSKQIHFDDNVDKVERVAYAKTLLDKLKNQAYPSLSPYLDTVIPRIETEGAATTVFGRKRRFERTDIHAIYKFLVFYDKQFNSLLSDALLKNRDNFYYNRRAVRQFLNALVQSTTSDYFQDMIYELSIHGKKLDVKLYVTVHDSIVGSVPKVKGVGNSLSKLITNIVNKMPEKRYPELPVHIGADCDFGMYYGKASKKIEESIMV